MKNNLKVLTGRFLTVVFLFLMCACFISCQPKDESKEIVPNRDINAVMNDHVDELMAIAGVVGVAVGELDDKTPCILVLIVEKTKEIELLIPKMLEGYPVSIFVSGEITPMQSN